MGEGHGGARKRQKQQKSSFMLFAYKYNKRFAVYPIKGGGGSDGAYVPNTHTLVYGQQGR